MTKTALITGITGQDGSYLAEFLIEKGYEVHGLRRRSSSFNTERIDQNIKDGSVTLHYGDLAESSSLLRVIHSVQPTEVYNLGAQSHVAVSFENPEYTCDVNGLGALRILEAIRNLNLERKCRFYQASTSELYGLVRQTPQNENTPFYPRSPYAISKLLAFWATVNYREAYNIYACNGILFNHESPRRGETFVTRKITRGIANIAFGISTTLELGNLDALRDWGHARDYVAMQWLMLQQDEPRDFVIATGNQHSVRQFVSWAAEEVGIRLRFEGEGVDEIGIAAAVDIEKAPHVTVGQVIIRVHPRYFRPTEVATLLGDAARARDELGWSPQVTARSLCAEMMAHDIESAQKLSYIRKVSRWQSVTR